MSHEQAQHTVELLRAAIADPAARIEARCNALTSAWYVNITAGAYLIELRALTAYPALYALFGGKDDRA